MIDSARWIAAILVAVLVCACGGGGASGGTAHTMTAVVVTPAVVRVGVGATVSFRATGIYSDATTTDLTSTATWASTQPAVAGVTGGGVSTALTAGSTTVSATSGSMTGTAPLSVVLPKFLYAANAASDSLSVFSIDPVTGLPSPVATVATGAGTAPTSIAVEPKGRFAYVANNGSKTFTAYTIDPTTGMLTQTASQVPGTWLPREVRPDPGGKFVYAANSVPDPNIAHLPSLQILAIDQNTGALSQVSTADGLGGFSFAIDAYGRFLYACIDNAAGSVARTIAVEHFVVNAASGAVTSGTKAFVSNVSPLLPALALDPRGSFAFVIDSRANLVTPFAIDQNTGVLAAAGSAVATGTSPAAIVVEPTGRFAYVANGGSNDISTYAIARTGGALTPSGARVAAGTAPTALAVDPTGKFLYVSHPGVNGANGTVSAYALDPTTGTPVIAGTANLPGPSAAALAVY